MRALFDRNVQGIYPLLKCNLHKSLKIIKLTLSKLAYHVYIYGYSCLHDPLLSYVYAQVACPPFEHQQTQTFVSQQNALIAVVAIFELNNYTVYLIIL